MELEKAINICKDFIKENRKRPIILHKAIETVLDELENKENKIHKCLETINQLKTGEYTKGSKHYYSSLCCNARLDILQDLLEGK